MEPAESRFAFRVPGQQPCLNDKHNAVVVVFDAVSIVVFGCVFVNGQFEPAESLLKMLVP